MISTISSKNEGHLLVYRIGRNAHHEYEAKLNKTLKKFTYKPITCTQVRVGVAPIFHSRYIGIRGGAWPHEMERARPFT